MEFVRRLFGGRRPHPPTSASSSAQPLSLGGDESDLFLQWLDVSNYHEACRFLQAHPDLVSTSNEERLRQALERAQQHVMSDAQHKGQIIEEIRQRLYLMRGLRVRITCLPQPATHGAITAAILAVYIDWHGGFMHDLPTWLDATMQDDATLRNQGQAYQTAQARVALWRAALQLAQHEGLAPEILAEIMSRQQSALDDTADGTNTAAQENGITLLRACLGIYTAEQYLFQWAEIQNKLGNAYQTRIGV